MRCGRCGNENDETNRFCGMCGASLVATTQAAGQPPAAAPAGSVATPRQAAVPVQAAPMQSAPRQTAQASVPEPARLGSATAEPRPASLPSSNARSSSGPVITGPSFLGLSTPGPAGERHAERDSLRPSSNLDYLLEDEEPRRGWGKLGFIVIALALAVGLGYLHFKQTGFGGLTPGDKKPTAAKPAADAAPGADSGGAAGPGTPDSTTPTAGASGSETAPATGGTATSPAGTAAGAATPSAASQMAPQTTPQTTPAQPIQTGTFSNHSCASATERSQLAGGLCATPCEFWSRQATASGRASPSAKSRGAQAFCGGKAGGSRDLRGTLHLRTRSAAGL